MLGRKPVVDVERTASDRLGQMAHEACVRVHRADDIAATVEIEQHAIGRRAIGSDPLCRHSAGIGRRHTDTVRLGCHRSHHVAARPLLFQRDVGLYYLIA